MAKTEIIQTKELAPIKARVTKMTSVVTDLVVKDQKGLEEASKVRSGIQLVLKQIKQWKDVRIKPINDSLKLLRADWKPLEDYCATAKVMIDKKVLAYNMQMEKKRDQKEKDLLKKVESGKITIEAASKKLEKTLEAPSHVVTDKGSLTIKKHQKFRVVDLSKLPIEYHVANETLIRDRMYKGVQLPGVEYYEEKEVSGS